MPSDNEVYIGIDDDGQSGLPVLVRIAAAGGAAAFGLAALTMLVPSGGGAGEPDVATYGHKLIDLSASCTGGVSATFGSFPAVLVDVDITGDDTVTKQFTGPGGSVSAAWSELGVDVSDGGVQHYGVKWTADGGGSGEGDIDLSKCLSGGPTTGPTTTGLATTVPVQDTTTMLTVIDTTTTAAATTVPEVTTTGPAPTVSPLIPLPAPTTTSSVSETPVRTVPLTQQQDMCANIDGIQVRVPVGLFLNEEDQCVEVTLPPSR